MPNIHTFIAEGVSNERKAELIAGLTTSASASLSSPPESVRIWISEIPCGSYGCAGTVPTAPDLGKRGLAFIQVVLIAGRTDAQKASLIASMTEVTVRVLDVTAEIVRVVIQDIPSTAFGIGGVTAKSLGR